MHWRPTKTRHLLQTTGATLCCGRQNIHIACAHLHKFWDCTKYYEHFLQPFSVLATVHHCTGTCTKWPYLFLKCSYAMPLLPQAEESQRIQIFPSLLLFSPQLCSAHSIPWFSVEHWLSSGNSCVFCWNCGDCGLVNVYMFSLSPTFTCSSEAIYPRICSRLRQSRLWLCHNEIVHIYPSPSTILHQLLHTCQPLK